MEAYKHRVEPLRFHRACHEAREFCIDCFWMALNRCCDFRCCFLAISEKRENLRAESDTRAFPTPQSFATPGLPAVGSIRESPPRVFCWIQLSSCRVRSQNVRRVVITSASLSNPPATSKSSQSKRNVSGLSVISGMRKLVSNIIFLFPKRFSCAKSIVSLNRRKIVIS